MANVKNFNNYVVTGTVVLERLAQVTIPPILRAHAAALESVHTVFSTAVERANDARGSRKSGVDVVVVTDDAMNQGLKALAGAMVAACLGTLRSPFASFGGKAVSEYAKGSRVRAAKEVSILLATIAKGNVPDAVRKAASKCQKQCSAIDAAYAKLGAQRVEFRRARVVRQSTFKRFTSAYADARNIAKVAWRDDRETYALVFGPIERDRFGKRVVHKKKKEKAAEAVTPPRTVTVTAATAPSVITTEG